MIEVGDLPLDITATPDTHAMNTRGQIQIQSLLIPTLQPQL